MKMTRKVSAKCCQCKHLFDALLDSPHPISCGRQDMHDPSRCCDSLAEAAKMRYVKNGIPSIVKDANCEGFEQRTEKFGDCRDAQALWLEQHYLIWPTSLAVEGALKLGKEWRFLWMYRFEDVGCETSS